MMAVKFSRFKIGEIGGGDGCWGQNVLVTSLRC